MHRIKNLKNLERLPSGNFRDSSTGIVYAKTIIEKLLSEKAEQKTAEKEVEKEVEKKVVNEDSEKQRAAKSKKAKAEKK